MEWVKPKQLEIALKESIGSSASILEAVCGRVESGMLDVKAERILVDGRESDDKSILLRLFGLRSRMEGSWNTGDFRGTLNKNKYQFMQVQALGVQFSKKDAENMGADFDSNPDQSDRTVSNPASKQAIGSTSPSSAGRRPSADQWRNFAAALAVVAANDDTGVVLGISASAIYEKVALVLQDRLGPNAYYLAKDTVLDAITVQPAFSTGRALETLNRSAHWLAGVSMRRRLSAHPLWP